MELAAEFVVWIVGAILVYTYVGYPALMALLATIRRRPVASNDITPSVTLVIAAYNEQKSIASKLDNVLALDYPPEAIEVLVGSDASTDETDRIVESFQGRDVRLVRVEGRQGKTAVQNECARLATGDVLIFTDATTVLRRDALRRIVRPFADATVGCVGARLVYTNRGATQVGHGGTSYWAYERSVKGHESAANSLIGVSGCFYAVRRDVYQPIEPALISDFVVALDTFAAGYRVVYEPSAVCEEETLRDASRELSMRVRVVLRTLRALARRRALLNPFRHGLYAIQLLSHKVLRYAVGVILIPAYVANAVLIGRPVYALLFAGQSAFYLAAALGHLTYRSANARGFLALPYYFVLSNLSAVIALGRAVRGESITTWDTQR